MPNGVLDGVLDGVLGALDDEPDDPADRLVTANAAAEALGVARGTVRSWIHRYHIRVRGLNEHGHRMYAYADLARIEADTSVAAGRTPETRAA